MPVSLYSSFQKWLFSFSILLKLLFCFVGAVVENNAVKGLPDVTCLSNRIQLNVNTLDSFNGKIFIKGNSHRDECISDFKNHPRNSPNDTVINIAVDYNLCNTERIRQLEPAGITYANTVIVQFHRTFITKGDKAYHIRCFYSETEQTVTSRFDVSMLATGSIQADMELPQCGYTVRRDTVNGPLVRTARVGDTVYHRWQCTGSAPGAFGMLVHSCFVENTSGTRTEILDSAGCTMDPLLLPTLQYSEDSNLAYAQSQVFKYPDNSFVYFRCQLKICSKADQSCQGVTPPKCEQGVLINGLSDDSDDAPIVGVRRRSRRANVRTKSAADGAKFSLLSADPEDNTERNGEQSSTADSTSEMDVVTNDILVLDEEDKERAEQLQFTDELETTGDHRWPRIVLGDALKEERRRPIVADDGRFSEDSLAWRLCTSRAFLAALVIGVVAFSITAAITIVLLMSRRLRSKMV